MKFKIVYVIVLLVVQNVFTFGQKEAVISEDCTGVPTFDITDPHMVFSNGLSVPKVGMNAHNKNGYDEIYLQDLSGRRSEILGQLSIEDHAVTSLTIINPNGIYVNGGSFFGAEKITLSALGQGDVWFNPNRVVLDKSTVMAQKPKVHIQDFKRFWCLNKKDWHSFCSDLEGQDTYELGMSLFIHYSKGNRGPKGGFFKKEFLFLYIEDVGEGGYDCDESDDRAYETELDESSGSADEASDADSWTPNEQPVVLLVYKDGEIPPEYQKTPLPRWKVAPPEETITPVFSDDNFGDTLAYLFDESLAREAPQNLVVKQNRVSVSTLNPIPVTAASALESENRENLLPKLFKPEEKNIPSKRSNVPVDQKSTLEPECKEELLSKFPKSEGKDILSGRSNIPVDREKSDDFFLLSQLDGSFFSAKIREEIGAN